MSTRRLFEVEAETRETDKPPQDLTGPSRENEFPPYLLMPPVCFAMNPSFRNEAKAIKNGGAAQLKILLDAERECTSFTEYKQGWTPREHWEMNQAAEMQCIKDRLEQDRHIREQAQEQDRRAREQEEKGRLASQQALEWKLEQSQKDSEHRMRILMFRVACISIFVTAIGIAVNYIKPSTPNLQGPPVINLPPQSSPEIRPFFNPTIVIPPEAIKHETPPPTTDQPN